jgi:hypothetical protein
MAVAVLVSGCGVRSGVGAAGSNPGSAAGPTTESGSLSATGYRTAAARACRAYRRQVAGLPAPRTPPQLTRYVAQLRVLTVRRIAALRALPAPGALAGRIRRLGRYIGPVIAAVDALSEELRHGRAARRAVGAFRAAIARLSPPIDTLWKAVGVPACVT